MKPSRLFASLPVRCAMLTTLAALTGCAYMTGAAPEWESRFGDAARHRASHHRCTAEESTLRPNEDPR